MESPTASSATIDAPPHRKITSPHPLNDVLLVDGFWADPEYPHQLGKEEWEENFFGLLNDHMAAKDRNEGRITGKDDLLQACAEFVTKWRVQQQPGGRFLRRVQHTNLWDDVGDKEAAAFIFNRLADSYNVACSFEEEAAAPETGAERVKLYFGIGRKTKVLNKSSRDISVIIADEKVAFSLSTKIVAGVSTPFVQVKAELGGGGEKEQPPPYCQEMMVVAGGHEDLELNQRNYYLTAFTKDENNRFAIHIKNRHVLARQDWVVEEEDLKTTVETLSDK